MMDIIDWQLDYIEDWSTGKCVSAMHGPPDCTLDRWQLCAKRMLSSSDAWAFVHCNFVQRLNLCGTPELAAPVDDDESGPVTNCTIGDQEIKVLQGCTGTGSRCMGNSNSRCMGTGSRFYSLTLTLTLCLSV